MTLCSYVLGGAVSYSLTLSRFSITEESIICLPAKSGSPVELGCHSTVAPFRPFRHLSVLDGACIGTNNLQSGVCCAALDEHRATGRDPEWGEVPRPGEVDLLHISPPCQDLSGLNQHTAYPKAIRNLLPLIDKVGCLYMRILFISASKPRALPFSLSNRACRIN